MRLKRLVAHLALIFALCLSVAPAAQAMTVIRNATGKDANDFHILFSGPADKLKLTSGNFKPGVTYPEPSPKQDQVDFMGGTVKNGNEFTINNLSIVKGLDGLHVLSWYFTKDGEEIPGEPLIKVGDTYIELKTITDKGFSIQAVPEPTTWALMILGFGLAGGALRRHAIPASRRLA